MIEKLFEKTAMFISRNPLRVIFLTLLVAIALTFGFLKLDVEKRVKYLFLPEDSEASRDILKARSLGFELELRQEEIIVLPKHNKSVLSQECLAEMVDLHNSITEINSFEKYCFRGNSSSTCASVNLLEIFDYNKNNFRNILGYIQASLRSDTFLMSNGRRLKDNFNTIFGNRAASDNFISTNALRMVYYMKELTSDEEMDAILLWEKHFLKKLEEFSKNTTCVEVFYAAERSLDDSVSESTGSDIKFFSITFTIMGIFSSVVNGRCADSRYGHQLLGFAALLSIYLGVTSAFGFVMFIGVPFVNMVGVLPFLVVSIGVDDVFIILHELNELVRKNIPAMHMISGTMARSGPTITMTTLTDLVAFAVSCRSLFPAVRYFCAYAAIAILFAFLMLVTFFVGCMWFDAKRINAKRRDFLPCFLSPDAKNCCSSIRRNGLDNVMKGWGRIITSFPGKVTVCLFSFLLLAGGIYGALNIDETFSRQLLTTEDSHYRKFLNVYEEHFHVEVEVNIITSGQIDYSNREIQQQYLDLAKIAKSNNHFTSRSTSWLGEFLLWAKATNLDINDKIHFYGKLKLFITLPEHKRFAEDVKFSQDETYITASRIFVYSKSNPNSNFQRDMMISIRKDLSRSSDLGAFAISQPFIYFEQFAHVLDETIRNLIVAGVSILLISSLFLNHFVIILCLLCGFLALILELFGLMYIWDVSINSISMINLVMALGFSVDYNTHVVYHFVSSKAESPELRVIDALGRIGSSVFLAGLSTFLGMMTTGFASSIVFQIFFKMFVGIVVLGLLHGLVILPVYLTVLGKLFDLREENIYSILYKWYVYKGKRTSHKVEKKKIPNQFDTAKKPKPVSVVGIGCRFPGGANSKDSFWDMLIEGKCGVNSYPTDRPDSRMFLDFYNPGKKTPGTHYVLTGSFLNDIDKFDAQFFGISPTECRAMDPQQRILLQVAYEAIEDAGLRLEDLQECRTGVYVGLMNLDYGSLIMDDSNIRNIDQFSSTGCASSGVSNRISFSLNLTGPSLTVDTACSSSLVAFDIAFGHLQSGECDVAIVCAPNILLSGKMFHTACCRTGLLAEDGRCKSFDIKGDGYGRGEGVAAVVIKPTKTALEDRDDIYAEVVACGMNNDGQTAIPMTAPSEVTQTVLFQRVLEESFLCKDDIQYIEAHGTGTAIGDVVEMGSVSAVYGNSSKRILRVGSVKSNINHTESTAGLAGLIKSCLMIKNAQFVPTINVHEVKPQLKMSERKMMVQLFNEPWKTESGKPRIAGLCSYGFGGTNAHLIIGEVMKTPSPIIPSRSVVNRVLTLSATSKSALKDMAMNLSQSLATKPDDDELLKDNICYSLNERYTVHSHRLAVSFCSLKQAVKALEMFAKDENGWEGKVTTGDTTESRKKVVFLYGGQGAQWYGMAREMLIYEPKFRKSIEKIDGLLKRYRVPWSLMTELNKPEETSRLHQNHVGQTALFSVHFALTELMKSWGVTPSAAVGHSLGEISAACASGALKLSEALHLVLIRSQLHEKCSPSGCMAAIGLCEDEAQNILQELHLENEIDIAVVNSPANIVLSGDNVSMELVEKYMTNTRGNVFWKKLTTTRAYHSQQMEEIKQLFIDLASKIKLRPCQGNISFYSTVTGTRVSGRHLSREHWWKNVRQTVLFSSALKALFADGYKFFVEINAAPQLSYHIHQTWNQYQKENSLNADVVVVQTLPKRSATEHHLSFLRNCVARLFTCGIPLSWNKVQGSGSKSFVRRPTYPWQETEFWYREEHPSESVTFLDEKKSNERKETKLLFHPLLGKAVPTETFTGLHAWESEINLYKVAYIKDHKFAESPYPVIPAAAYVEMALAMSLGLSPKTAPDVHNISFNNLLTISENDSFRIRTRILPEESAGVGNHFQITIVEEKRKNEVVLSEGVIQLGVEDGSTNKDNSLMVKEDPSDFEIFKSRMVKCPEDFVLQQHKDKGFAFGPQFNLITEAWSNANEALALISPTQEIINEAPVYVVHPSIIDACTQATLLVKHADGTFVPSNIEVVSRIRKIDYTNALYSYVEVLEFDKQAKYNITLYDGYARPVMILQGFVVVKITEDRTKIDYENAAFTTMWSQEEQTVKSEDDVTQKSWLILADRKGYAKECYQHLADNIRTTFVDMQDTVEETRSVFGQTLDEALESKQQGEKLLVVNFWPSETSQIGVENQNFMLTHSLAFENCLVVSQEILKRKSFGEEIQLVIVTIGVVSKALFECCHTNDTPATFPWSATVFGFRRTFSEEINAPKASVIDLPENPDKDDFLSMIQDLRTATIEEEIAFRNGERYVNRLTKLKPQHPKHTKQESPINHNKEGKPFKLAFMSGKMFLRTVSEVPIKGKRLVDVYFASPVLHKHWTEAKTSDCVAIAGKLCTISKETQQNPLMIGVCKFSDLGSYVATDGHCFTEIQDDLTPQQAASLCYPMALSYHILKNLITDIQGKKVLVHHQSEEICCIIASVAITLGANVVCLVKNRACKDRVKKFGIPEVITEDEVVRQDVKCENYVDMDSVCFLSKTGGHVSRQVMKHLKSGGTVIAMHEKQRNKCNNFTTNKDVHLILTDFDDFPKNSEIFSKLLVSCSSSMKSSGMLKKLLEISQISTSIYDVVLSNNTSSNHTSQLKSHVGLSTASLKPENVPEKMSFYRLPLDSNGFKGDRTYLVIGGVRGFGFEVAKWLVENGAKTVMCTARSPPSEKKILEVQQLEQDTGSRILLRQADVTCWKEMNVIKDELDSLPAVAGVMFSAVVLEDQLIKDADLETCKRVVGTKVQGSVILHQLSLSMDLDFFIMFSSVTAVLGNIGQVSYAAANTFLDHLCEYRRNKLGLPALSVNWGPISGAGILERNANVSELLQNVGFYPLHYKTALEFLKRVLVENPDEAQVCLSGMNWQVYLKTHVSPRFKMIRDENPTVNQNTTITTLEDLALQPLEFRVNYVQEFIKRLLSSWSGADIAELDLNVGLHKYGIDSIAATNMKFAISSNIGATFETYYFIQPKTSGLTIINDILEQIKQTEIVVQGEEDLESLELEAHDPEKKATKLGGVISNGDNHLEFKATDDETEVIPLYVPEEAILNVFLVHGSQKSALALAPFALGFQEQTLVALYGIGVNKSMCEISDYGTVPALAQRYVELIQEIQPNGPYNLAGYSFGGTVAYEMASELTRIDEDVAMVFLVDTNAWFPKTLDNGREMFLNFGGIYFNKMKDLVIKQMIERTAFVQLGITRQELDALYERHGNRERVMKVIEEKAAETKLDVPLKHAASCLEYQLKAARNAHNDWQPSKIRYEKTLTYVRNDECNGFPFLWSAVEIWKSLSETTDFLHVPGSHLEMRDESGAKVCGTMMMTTAAMKYQSTFPTLNLHVVRSRSQERLVESIKQGITISILSNANSLKATKGAFWLDSNETTLIVESHSYGFLKQQKILLKDITNILPGRHVHAIQNYGGHNSYIDFLVCMLTTKGKLHTFRCSDWQQLNHLTDAFDALFGIRFLKTAAI